MRLDFSDDKIQFKHTKKYRDLYNILMYFAIKTIVKYNSKIQKNILESF